MPTTSGMKPSAAVVVVFIIMSACQTGGPPQPQSGLPPAGATPPTADAGWLRNPNVSVLWFGSGAPTDPTGNQPSQPAPEPPAPRCDVSGAPLAPPSISCSVSVLPWDDLLTSISGAGSEQFITGQSGRLYASLDGGDAWHVAVTSDGDLLTAVTVSADRVFAVGSDVAKRGANGPPLIDRTSSTWQTTRIPAGVWASSIASTSHGLYVALDGGIAVSTDNGTTWLFTAATPAKYTAITFANCGELLAVGTLDDGPQVGQSILVRSRDYGQSWATLPAPKDSVAITAAGDTYLVATLGGDAFRSPDRGASWKPTLSTAAPLRSVAAIADPQIAIAAGDASELHYSTDDGANWSKLSVDGVHDFWGSFISPGRKLFAVGSSGAILRCSF